MKRWPTKALVALPILFTAACTSGSPLAVMDKSPSSTGSSLSSASSSPSSARSSPSSARVSECDKTSSKSNSVVMVNWVDFVQLGDLQFIADEGPGPSMVSSQMLAVVGRVRCQLSALKFSEDPGPSVDGDASFLTVGTEVHSVLGFEPACRVAARLRGTIRVYLAHHDVGGHSTAVPCAKAP